MRPFLSPALPTSAEQPSFADEVEQDLRRRESSDAPAHLNSGTTLLTPSIIFPPSAQPGHGAVGMEPEFSSSSGDGAPRTRSILFPTSSSARPLSQVSGSTVLPYDDDRRSSARPTPHPLSGPPRASNGHDLAGEASRMMRPQSQSSLRYRAAHPSRMGKRASTRSLVNEPRDDYVRASDPGAPRRLRRERSRSLGDDESGRGPRLRTLSGPGKVGGEALDEEDGLADADTAGEIDFDGRDDGEDGFGARDGQGQERENGDLSSEEAWYFLRSLVGQEIQREEGLLWKLKDLDGASGVEDGEGIDPAEVPILRYLIRHFLLTLPLVRDTVSDGDVPAFWVDGLHPIIRSLHDADLSKPVDRGYQGITSRLYGSSCRNALERFVTAGLKLSSSTYDSPTNLASPTAPAMQPQTSSTSTQRYNFQPLVPAPYPESPDGTSSPNGKPARPLSAARSASWSRRFSFGRIFGGGSAGPAGTSSPPRLPPPVLASPLVMTSASSSSETENGGVDSRRSSSGTRRESSGPARPDSAVLPSMPFLGAAAAAAVPVAAAGQSASRRRSSSRRSSAAGEELEELSLQPTRSRATSTHDAESFVTAGEGRASRASHSVNDHDDGTLRIPTSAPASAYATPALTAGLAATPAFFAGTGEDGAAADADGLGPSSSEATTPKQQQSALLEGDQSVRAASTTTSTTPAEPYVVDEPTQAASSLAPPIPNVGLPYQESSTSAPKAAASSTPSRTRMTPIRPVKSPERQRTLEPAPDARASTSVKLNHKFSFGGLLKGMRRSSASGAGASGSDSGSPRASHDVVASRRIPLGPSTPQERGDVVAHSGLPAQFVPPVLPPSSGDDTSASGAEYEPSGSALPPVLVPKGGAAWPFDASVPFLQGPEFEHLKWGGFEADVVGVRKSLFSHSFIIRVRRPGRLDEFVLRTEAQFLKFSRNMPKHLPEAHLRRIPAGAPKNDPVIRPRPTLVGMPSAVSLQSGAGTEPGSRSHSRLVNGLRAAAADPHGSPSMSRPPTRSSVGSTFTRSLRAQSVHAQGESKTVRQRRSRAASLSASALQRPQSAVGSYRSYPTSFGSRAVIPAEIGKKMPPHDPRRRALRAWLRDVLSVRGVGHHKETAAFLLAGSIVPRDADVMDIAKREAIDDARRNARSNDAYQSVDKVRATRDSFSAVEEEIIHGEGLGEISEALKTKRSIDELPAKYQKVLEGLRFDFAATIYEALVGSETSGMTFSKLKALHTTFPWFIVKQALRLKGSNFMARRLQDILISRPLGGKSLLQKILAITLDDDPVRLAKEMDRLQARIGSAVMVEKLNLFVHESREKKAIIRRYADENKIELVLCIVRGADEPRLPGFELDRITAASKAYRKWAKTNPSPVAKLQVRDSDIRLVLDLQAYLRLASRDRDATVLRQLLAQEDFASAVEITTHPFISFLKRTYKVGHGAQALTDFQSFLDQLIIIVEALRSRIQDPQKSVRVIARLLQRHQQNLYSFVRSVHRSETIIEEFLQWAWTASVFLRRGLAQPIDLDELVPLEGDGEEDKAYLLEELEDLVSYHRAKRLDTFQAACRRAAGDVDADDPILVEGDGKGRSQVDPVVEPRPRAPRLSEVPLYVDAFTVQLKSVFAV
ncbi:hypothetical protein JCM8208_000800 [Rhodotorula glutinis]